MYCPPYAWRSCIIVSCMTSSLITRRSPLVLRGIPSIIAKLEAPSPRFISCVILYQFRAATAPKIRIWICLNIFDNLVSFASLARKLLVTVSIVMHPFNMLLNSFVGLLAVSLTPCVLANASPKATTLQAAIQTPVAERGIFSSVPLAACSTVSGLASPQPSGMSQIKTHHLNLLVHIKYRSNLQSWRI